MPIGRLNRAAGTLAKFAVICAALFAGTVVAGLLMPAVGMPPISGPEPFSAGTALLIVTNATALVLAVVASHLAGSFGARAAGLFALTYGLDTLLPLTEAVIFEDVLRIPRELLLVGAGVGFARALCGAVAAALLFRSTGEPEGFSAPLMPRLAAAAILYVALYFAAGYAIAWQSEAVRQFYGEGVDIPSPMALVVPQLLRGLGFAMIVALVLNGLSGSRARNALLIASAFGLLTALPLLQPNEAMPWAVRRVHFVELAFSNFLFGLATVMILAAHRPWRIGRRLA